MIMNYDALTKHYLGLIYALSSNVNGHRRGFLTLPWKNRKVLEQRQLKLLCDPSIHPLAGRSREMSQKGAMHSGFAL